MVWNDKILTRKSEILQNFDGLKFDEKAEIANYSSCQNIKNLERTYMLDNNKNSDKFNERAQLEFYRDSLKHNFLVVSRVL